MNRSESINELVAALAKAQGAIQMAKKDSMNPHFNRKYADLAACWAACREPLAANGLAVTQVPYEREPGKLYLETVLAHASGQWISSELPIDIQQDGRDGKRNQLQALGSAITYVRRYALCALVGVAPDDDDDGNSAGPRDERREERRDDRREQRQAAAQTSATDPAHEALSKEFIRRATEAADQAGVLAVASEIQVSGLPAALKESTLVTVRGIYKAKPSAAQNTNAPTDAPAQGAA